MKIMKTATRCAFVLTSVVASAPFSHASGHASAPAWQHASYPAQTGDGKKAMDEAIGMYLASNPPEALAEYIHASVAKALPASLSPAEREKALNHLRANLTPDIVKRMLSSGLRRNFTVDEVRVLSHYDDSQLSDELRSKNDRFRRELSGEIGLYLAATSG